MIYVQAGTGRIRLLDIEINGNRIKNGAIWQYFRNFKDMPVLG